MKKIKKICLFTILSFFSLFNKVNAAKSCEDAVSQPVATFFVDLFNMIKWIALALALVLGMLDFFKAITGSKDDELSKSAQKFGKRLIAVVVLFILPYILEWILDISGIDHGGTCLS